MCVTLQVYLIKWCTGPDSIHRLPSTDLPSTENTNNNNNNNNNLNQVVVTPPTDNNTTPPSTCWKKMVVCCKSKEELGIKFLCHYLAYIPNHDEQLLLFLLTCNKRPFFSNK